jgi:hypothetical protein
MNKVIDRIKKLLRMKKGGTPEEIATALRLAQSIAADHGIDLAGINPDEDERARRIGHIDAPASRAYEQALANQVITGWFDCDTCFYEKINGRRVTCVVHIAGEEHAREIGRYVYVFLVRAFRRAWQTRSNRRLRNRKAFLFGMYCGVVKNLPNRPSRAERDSNALVQSRRAYLQELHPNMKSINIKHGYAAVPAAWHGYREGLKTQIRPGVDGGAERATVSAHGTARLLEGGAA